MHKLSIKYYANDLEALPMATRLICSLSALLVAILGATVLLGWYLHNVTLIQVTPIFVPMQYNTALAFLLLGCSCSRVLDARFNLDTAS